MPMHVRVSAGGGGRGVPPGYAGARCSTSGAALTGVWHPSTSVLSKKANFLAVKGGFGFPAVGSTAPLSSMGTMGGPSSLPPPPRVCLCPRMALPRGCHQPVPAGLHPWVHPSTAFCPVQGDSHHHVLLASVIPACSLTRYSGLYPHGHYRTYSISATGWSQHGSARGAGAPALSRAAEPVRAQHRDTQEPYQAM